MGLFSKFKKKKKINLKKSDFKTEKEGYNAEITYESEEFLKSIVDWKKKNGIAETKKETDKHTSASNIANISLFGNKVRVQFDPTEIEIEENEFISQINQKLNWILEKERLDFLDIAEINGFIVNNIESGKIEYFDKFLLE